MIEVNGVVFNIPEDLEWSCVRCGRCCKERPADLNDDEIERIEKAGYEDFYDEVEGFAFFKSDEDGACVFLSENDQCEIYDIRPVSCRSQPFSIEEYDRKEKKLIAYTPSFMIEECEGFRKGKVSEETLAGVAISFKRVFEDLKHFVSQRSGLPLNSAKNIKKVNQILRDMTLNGIQAPSHS